MARLKVAVIGCGWVGGSQIERGFAELADRFEVIAACDTDPERLATFADRYGVARRETSLAAILAVPDVDVVSICTPPNLHCEQVLAALRADKHVICEKPFMASLAELDLVEAEEAKSRTRAMPIFQYRFGNGIAKVKHVIDSGLAGRAYVSAIETAWRRGPDYYKVAWRGKFATELGGVLLTQSIHMHDLLLYLLGPASAVAGFKTTRVNKVEVEDCAVGSLVMADGSLASLTATLGSALQITRLRLCFENVTFEKQCEGDAAGRPGDEPWTVIPTTPEIGQRLEQAMSAVPSQKSGFARQFELFADALETGAAFPVTFADARRSLELVTALFHANETGKVVSLPLSPDHPKYRGWRPAAQEATA
jgi:predicted dehydrogenase